MDTNFLKIMIIGFLTSRVQCDDFFKLSQLSQDMEDILHTIESPTLTFCQMQCYRDLECENVGFKKSPGKGFSFICHLLGKKSNAKPNPKSEVNIIKLNSLTPGKKWKRHVFIGCKQAFENKQFGTIEITEQIKMHVEVMLTKDLTEDLTEGSPLVHFTQGGLYGKGRRLPYISLRADNRFFVVYDVNGDYNYHIYFPFPHPFNKWIVIEVSQLKEDDGFIYSIAFDGEKVHSVKNKSPKVFKNVKVFLGHIQKKLKQPGFVRNFWMDVEE